MICRHGETDSHGEVGKDWCPGALPLGAEPWRSQLEFQMNAPSLFEKRVPTREETVWPVHPASPLLDHLSEMRPIGYFIDGRWCMFEKPGEYVSMPVVPQ